MAAGYVIGMDGVRVLSCGRHRTFLDMKLIGDLYHPDIALLPIGGRYTMGTAEAMMAASFIGAEKAMQIHFNTWDEIKTDPLVLKKALERTTDIKVTILKPGESMECTPSE